MEATPDHTVEQKPPHGFGGWTTGGKSLLRGGSNLVKDLRHNRGMPLQVDSSPFRVGENVGAQLQGVPPLKDIRQDDAIELTTLDGTFAYKVEWTKIVAPEETHVLADAGTPSLTLVTCYPFYYVGSAPKRFIVRAHRLDRPEVGP